MNGINDIDLPSLQSIQLGESALRGCNYVSTCSLTMQSNNEIIRNDRM